MTAARPFSGSRRELSFPASSWSAQTVPSRSVNFRREGDFLVVDKVAHQWTLRNGDQATCVFNLRKPSPQAVASQSLSGPRRLDGSSSLF